MVQADSVFSCAAILQSFIEMAEAHPKMMKPYLPNIIDTMFVIMNNEVRRCLTLPERCAAAAEYLAPLPRIINPLLLPRLS